MAHSVRTNQPLHFRKRHRIGRSRDYQRVYDAKVRRRQGPLIVFALPNGLEHSRLGLSVGRKVGNAVARHAIKRQLREAFRLLQHDIPAGYDLVVNVLPHEKLPLADYLELMKQLAFSLHSTWQRRLEQYGEHGCSA